MKLFENVGSLMPGRSAFNLSYEKKLTCDMGQLIPVLCDEMVPGDVFTLGNEVVVRMQPLVAPVLHEINLFVHYYFVPYRILWDEWEDFITGGPDGDSAAVLPLWTPTKNTLGTLWDFLGLPLGVDPQGIRPVDFIRRGYNRIYNEYYRDESLVPEVSETNEDILIRAWQKDRYTSALLEQQRGTAPALPVTVAGKAVWAASSFGGTHGIPVAPWYSASDAVDNHLYSNDVDPDIAANQRGFQELITEQMAWWNTHWDMTSSKWVTRSAGKQPIYRDWETDRKSTRLNSSHRSLSRMPSSA